MWCGKTATCYNYGALATAENYLDRYLDPETDSLTPLFNPRINSWRDHFAMVGVKIVGLTEIGRATVRLLLLNEPEHVETRRELESIGELDIDDSVGWDVKG